jgi:hypothetical protein
MKIITPGAPLLFLSEPSIPGKTIFYNQIINFHPGIPGWSSSIGIGLKLFLQLIALTATLQAHHASHLCR